MKMKMCSRSHCEERFLRRGNPEKAGSPRLAKSTRLAMTIVACVIAQSAFAASLPKPAACPSIAAIKSVGVNHASGDGPLGWMAWNEKSRYDTNEEWTFVMFGIEPTPEDEEEALARFNASLAKLSLIEGPEKTQSDKDEWACIYGDSKEQMNTFAAAITPPTMPELVKRVRR